MSFKKLKHLNERREDYALQVVPEAFRQWSWVSLLSVLLGASTAMFFMIFGGTAIALYGTHDLIIGMVSAAFCIGSLGFILAITASETGLDMDLITSGSGMGYKGAGFTSLIYAVAYITYFAIEGSIIASAIHVEFSFLPLWLLYISIGLAFIPLTWYGLTAMNYLMWISLPIYVVLLAWCIFKVIHMGTLVDFLAFKATTPSNPAAGPALLQLFAIIPALVGNGMIAADIGRFIPKKRKMIAAIALGYFMNILSFIGGGLLGAWFSLKLGQADPGIYFPGILGLWGMLFVIISQIRINSLNTYSGSLAMTTFFSRIFNFAPGRHWWVVLLPVLAIFMMLGHVITHLTSVMIFESVFMVAWIMAVLSYILFNRTLFKISPKNFPFTKGTIPNYDPIGLTALMIALVVAVPMSFGIFGPYAKTLAPFIAALLAFISVPIITLLRKRKSS